VVGREFEGPPTGALGLGQVTVAVMLGGLGEFGVC